MPLPSSRTETKPLQKRRLQQDTRTLLRIGLALVAAGALSALLMLTSFGGITRRQGPHTNAGWLALMIAMGCLPTGTLSLLLGIAKALGDRRR
jgi:hypothetical protein